MRKPILASLLLVPSLVLASGYSLPNLSGLRTSTYSPSLPDASSWAFSAGAGFRVARGFSVDVGVFYALLDEVTSTRNSASEPAAPTDTGTFRGTYNPSALIYGVSVGWMPGARGAMP